MPLTARTILVTGASRGLGLEFVKQILKLPSAPEVLVAACRDPTSAKKLQDLAQANPAVKIVKMDIERDEDIESAFQETKKVVGDRGLNLLINNAGVYIDKTDGGGLLAQTRDRLQAHFNVNATSQVMVIQKFLSLLQQAATQSKSAGSMSFSKSGVVVISSVMGSQTVTYASGAGTSLDYKCSKSAVTMACILISRELKNSGILVTALHPGWVKTDMGGSQADLTVDESVRGCLNVITNANNGSTGKLINYKGEILPY